MSSKIAFRNNNDTLPFLSEAKKTRYTVNERAGNWSFWVLIFALGLGLGVLLGLGNGVSDTKRF